MDYHLTIPRIRIRNWSRYWALKFYLAWYRFRMKEVVFAKTEFAVVSLFILLIGIGLGMAWRAVQVEPVVDAEIMRLSGELAERRTEIRRVIHELTDAQVRLQILEGRTRRARK